MDPVKQMYEHVQRDLDKQHENYSPPPIRFRASEAGECSRRIWYRLSGYKPESAKSAFMEFLTAMGDLAHDVVRWRMKRAGVELFDLTFDEESGSITEDNSRAAMVDKDGEKFTVSFRADGGVMIDGVPHVLEVKSIDGFSYNAMKNVFDKKGWPGLMDYLRTETDRNRGDKYSKWFGQADVSGLLSKEKVHRGYLIIGDRSMGQFGFNGSNEGMAFDLDEDHLQEILRKFAMINRMVRDGTPPMQEYVQTSRDCGYCPYRIQCWKG